jgi:hypothetical protein
MSNEKDASSSFRKKYLYLEKFTAHQEDDRVWKLSTNERLDKMKKRIDNAITSLIVGIVIAGCILLIVIMK